MNNERLNTLVGLILLPLLGVALASVLWFGQRPLRPTVGLVAEFDQVEQLQVGAKVLIANREVGRVTGIGFRDQRKPGETIRRVQVHFYVERRYAHQIWTNSPAYVSSTSLIGERHLELDAPEKDPSRPVRQGDVLMGTSPAYFDRLYNLGYESLVATTALTDAISPYTKGLGSRLHSVSNELKALEAHQRRIESLADRAEAVVNDAKGMYRELQESTDDFKAFDRVGKRLGNFGQRAKAGGRPLVRDMERLIERMEDLVKLLRERVPPVMKVAQARSRRIAARFRQVEHMLSMVEAAISQGEGTVGAFLKEKELFDDFKVSGKIIRQEIWRTIARPEKTTVKDSPAVP